MRRAGWLVIPFLVLAAFAGVIWIFFAPTYVTTPSGKSVPLAVYRWKTTNAASMNFDEAKRLEVVIERIVVDDDVKKTLGAAIEECWFENRWKVGKKWSVELTGGIQLCFRVAGGAEALEGIADGPFFTSVSGREIDTLLFVPCASTDQIVLKVHRSQNAPKASAAQMPHAVIGRENGVFRLMLLK